MAFVDDVLQPGVELIGRSPVANVVEVDGDGWCRPDGAGSRCVVRSDSGFEAVVGWRDARSPADRAQAVLDAWKVLGWAYPRKGWFADLDVTFDAYVQALEGLSSRYGIALPRQEFFALGEHPHLLEVLFRLEVLDRCVHSRTGFEESDVFQDAANGLLSAFAPRYGPGLLRVRSGDLALADDVSVWDLAMFGVWRWASHTRTCLLCANRYVRQFDGGEGFAKSSSMYCSRRCAMAMASRAYRRRQNDAAEVVE